MALPLRCRPVYDTRGGAVAALEGGDMAARTRFFTTGDGVRIAYATLGQGPPLVVIPLAQPPRAGLGHPGLARLQ